MRKTRALALIVISSFLFALQGIFFRNLTPLGFTPMQLTAVRGTVSAVLLSLFVLLTNRKLFRVTFKELLLIIPAGVFMFLCAFTYYLALESTTIATATVLMYTSPVYVLLFSVLFLKERLTVTKAVAVAVMLVGMALVSGIAGGMEFHFLGVFFAVLAGVLYAAYNIVAKIEMRRGTDPVTAMIYCFLIMGVLASLFADVPRMVEITAEGETGRILLMLVGMGALTCAMPYLFYTVALKYVPAGTASALGLLEPMAAIIYSMIFFDEPLTVPLAVGVVLILGAVFVISRIKE